MTLATTISNAITLAFAKTSSLTGTATLRRRTSSHNTATNDVSVISTDTIVNLVFDDSEESGLTPADVIEGKRIAYIQSSVEPEMDDEVIGPAQENYVVLKVWKIATYDTVFLYKLLLRM